MDNVKNVMIIVRVVKEQHPIVHLVSMDMHLIKLQVTVSSPLPVNSDSISRNHPMLAPESAHKILSSMNKSV